MTKPPTQMELPFECGRPVENVLDALQRIVDRHLYARRESAGATAVSRATADVFSAASS